MEIPRPGYQLNINNMPHGKMTGRMLEGLEELILKEEPNIVLVYGDTNSTLAGALAASKLHVPIAHVEAGLRSFNMEMPEEINRIITDRISQYLFCPTHQAIKNLHNEGFESFNVNILNTGDVMYDAALYYEKRLHDRPSELSLPKSPFALATLHRQENVKDHARLKSLIEGLNEVNNSKLPVIMPLHPGTANQIRAAGLKVDFTTIKPVGYFDMIRFLKACNLVLTDSGGLQKEAFFFQKFCITLRNQTEWVELVDHKVNFLATNDKEQLISVISGLIHKHFPKGLQFYGDGTAGTKIVTALRSA